MILNDDILECNADSVKNKISQYKQKWLNRVSRLEDIRYQNPNSLTADLLKGDGQDNH